MPRKAHKGIYTPIANRHAINSADRSHSQAQTGAPDSPSPLHSRYSLQHLYQMTSTVPQKPFFRLINIAGLLLWRMHVVRSYPLSHMSCTFLPSAKCLSKNSTIYDNFCATFTPPFFKPFVVYYTSLLS